MKKFFVLAAAAALTLASCAKVETYNVSDDAILSFGVYTGRSLTRADLSNYASGVTLVNNAQFGVYGWYTENGTAFTATAAQLEKQFMDWYTVTCQTAGNGNGNGSKNLYPDGYRYWPTGNTPNWLSFCAYYPMNDGQITAPAKGLGAYTFTAEDAAADQVDFMVSDVVADQTYDTRNGNPGTNEHIDGEVHLKFRHMLTKVKFQFKTTADVADDTKSHIKIYLTDAKLQDIRNAGTLTSDFDGTDFTTEWSGQSGNKGYEIFVGGADITDSNKKLLTATAADVASADADLFLMVPQGMVTKTGTNPQALYLKWDVEDLVTGVTTENEATVYFKDDLKDGDDPTTAAGKEIDWAKNMFVTYTITISPQPILFTADAQSWDAEQFGYFNVN